MKSADTQNEKEPVDSVASRTIRAAVRQAWRIIVLVVGGTVILIGIIMIVTPGPAMVMIPLGLGILAVEFVWARRLLRRIKVSARWQLRKQRSRGVASAETSQSDLSP